MVSVGGHDAVPVTGAPMLVLLIVGGAFVAALVVFLALGARTRDRLAGTGACPGSSW